RRQRAVAHRRNVEDRCRVWMFAIRSADIDAKKLVRGVFGSKGVVQPLVAGLVNIVLRSERALVECTFGALIDNGALVARERHTVLVVLEKVLPHLGANLLEKETQMRGDGVVPQNSVMALEEIAQAHHREETEEGKRGGNVGDVARIMPSQGP